MPAIRADVSCGSRRRFHRAAPISRNVAAGNRRRLFRHAEVLDWTLISEEASRARCYYRLYTSINPTPLVLSFPRTIAVYAPGVRSAAMADSRSSLGARPASSISAC